MGWFFIHYYYGYLKTFLHAGTLYGYLNLTSSIIHFQWIHYFLCFDRYILKCFVSLSSSYLCSFGMDLLNYLSHFYLNAENYRSNQGLCHVPHDFMIPFASHCFHRYHSFAFLLNSNSHLPNLELLVPSWFSFLFSYSFSRFLSLYFLYQSLD